MLTAYFDESYNHPNKNRPNEPLVYTVACWLSTEAKWKKFGRRWKRILHDAGLDYFHMTDYESRRPAPYNGWSDVKRLRILQELHRAIRDHRIYGCAIVVNCAAWNKLIKPNPRLRNIFGRNYYAFDVQIAVRAMNEWCDRQDYDGPIKYIFAELPKQTGVLDPMFRMLNTNLNFKKRFRVSGTWTKGLMKRVVQLQAADIIAYEINKRAAYQYSADSNYLRKSLASLELEDHFEPLYFGESEIKKLLKVTLH